MDDPKGAGATVVKSDETAPAGSETGPAASGEHLRQLEGGGPTTLPTAPDGCYDLGDEHARGGLGRIVRGRDRRLDRTVAIKQLIRGTPVNRARFAREARITARLQHPGVVPIYEAGVWPSGQQFYAMRLVEGRPLSAAIDDARTLAERLALLSRVLVVAETMAYAHSRGVIHRDLKPSNVLVGEYGETVVIDWGIAKELGEADAAIEAPVAVPSVDLTVVGQVMGTPWYMAPEQARGEPTDERSDVYALGAILYHVLAGVPPHADATKIVDTVAAGTPPPPLASRAPGVAADLVAIVDKALAAAPQARYPSADQLAADLKRYLNGQLVSVHRYGLGALVGRWIARHRAAVAIGALAALALAVGGAISVRNVVSARDEARRNAAALSAQRDALILTQAESALDRDPTAALAWLKQYPLTGAEWNRVRTIAADAVSRGVAKHVLKHGEEAYGVAMSADGTTILTTSENSARTWNAATGEQLSQRHLRDGRLAALSDDGHIAVAASAFARSMSVWRRGDDTPRVLHSSDPLLTQLAISSGTKHLVATGISGTNYVWGLGTGGQLHQIAAAPDVYARDALLRAESKLSIVERDGAVSLIHIDTGEREALGVVTGRPSAIASSPRADSVAVATTDGIWLWSRGAALVKRIAPDVPLLAMRFAGDNALAALTADRSLRVWQLDSPKEKRFALDAPITVLATARDGSIAIGGAQGTVTLLRPTVDHDYAIATYRGHKQAINDIAFSRDVDVLASISHDYEARLWRLAPPAKSRVLIDSEGLFQVAYVPNSEDRIVSSRSGRVYRLRPDGSRDVVGTHGASAFALATSKDGHVVASAAWDGSVMIWKDGVRSDVRLGQAPLWSVALSPDGRWIAAGGDEGLFLGAVGEIPKSMVGHTGRITAVAFSPDGRLLATTSGDASVRVWDVERATIKFVLSGHRDESVRPTFTPDGKTIVTGSRDGSLRAWSTADGSGRLVGNHSSPVRALAISVDGRRVATGSRDSTIRLWDLVTGTSTLLGRHEGEVRDIAFSPDGVTLATAGFDASVRIWDLASRSGQPVRGAAIFHRVAFRADGHELTATCEDGTLLQVPLPQVDALAVEPTSLRRQLGKLTGAELGAD